MSTNKKLSVIIPAYDATYLDEVINSINLIKPYELIVVSSSQKVINNEDIKVYYK